MWYNLLVFGVELGGLAKHNIRQTHETPIEMVRGSRVKQAPGRRALPTSVISQPINNLLFFCVPLAVPPSRWYTYS